MEDASPVTTGSLEIAAPWKASRHPSHTFFGTSHLAADLKRRSVRGGMVTLSAQGVKFLLTLGAQIALARLLTPFDYGVVGMVTAVTGFVALFKDLGLGLATVQRAEVNHELVSTLFWINLATGACASVVAMGLAPLIAWFYGEPRLLHVTMTLAVGFLLGGAVVQHQALLTRQMRFASLVRIDVCAILVAVAVAILCAAKGLGYWALVIAELSKSFTTVVLTAIACPWIPGRPIPSRESRTMFRFGRNLTGYYLLNYVGLNLDNVLVGRFWGVQALGFYAKAYQMLLLPLAQINAPISGVAIPTLSRLVGTPQRYRRAFLRILEKVALLTMPGVVFMIAASDLLIPLLLGERWRPVSKIFAWLGVAGIFSPMSACTGYLLISRGETGRHFRWGVFSTTVSICSFVAGLPWGGEGVAASYAITSVAILTPLQIWYACRTGPVRASDVCRTVMPLAIAAGGSLLSAIAYRRLSLLQSPVTQTFAVLIVTGTVFTALLAASEQGRNVLVDTWRLVIRRGSGVGSTPGKVPGENR